MRKMDDGNDARHKRMVATTAAARLRRLDALAAKASREEPLFDDVDYPKASPGEECSVGCPIGESRGSCRFYRKKSAHHPK